MQMSVKACQVWFKVHLHCFRKPNRAAWVKVVHKAVKGINVRPLTSTAALKRRLDALRRGKGAALRY